MNSQNLEINKDSYVAFDATSLRDLIIARLNKNNVFTDQNYVGSNISNIIEIISYSFSTLMFYLNKTSTESMFTETSLYENMNRIVKLLGYSPTGCQTASVSFKLQAKDISIGSYTIPRYSYISLGGFSYSFAEDVPFIKSTNFLQEDIDSVANLYRLYQGRFVEYPTYTANGSINEVVTIAIDADTVIDHFNIDVYVKNNKTNKWSQWNRVDNLYLNTARDEVCEIRLNENKRYEIKFGNNINGKSLNQGDQVCIYYLQSAGSDGEIGAAALNESILSKYNSKNYITILNNTSKSLLTILSDLVYDKLAFTNDSASTLFATYDTVEDIRNKAPKFFKAQNRLVTLQDYKSFIDSNFSNILADSTIMSNDSYVLNYIKYFYDIGLSSPHLESRVLYNQVNFANSCNFNNIYVFALPRTSSRTYLMPSQKQSIIETVRPYKTPTADVIIADPVYVAADIAIKTSDTVSIEDINNTEIYIEVDKYTKRSNNAILSNVREVFESYFDKTVFNLGSTINLYQIYADILNIDGLKRFYCKHKLNDAIIEGISLIVWNPIYANADVDITTQNFTLPDFKCIYLNNIDSLINRIIFTNSGNITQNINL